MGLRQSSSHQTFARPRMLKGRSRSRRGTGTFLVRTRIERHVGEEMYLF